MSLEPVPAIDRPIPSPPSVSSARRMEGEEPNRALARDCRGLQDGARMRRFAVLAVVLVAAVMSSFPTTARAAEIHHSGHVTGDLKAGKVATVHIRITHPQGWQSVQSVAIALRLRGRTLDLLEFTASELSLSIQGDAGSLKRARSTLRTHDASQT